MWCAPRLWRSEFSNVLAVYLRQGAIDLDQALALSALAEHRIGELTYEVPPPEVLRLVNSSTCSAYDCEFVALAQDFGVPLITEDRKVLKQFPTIAMDMKTFLSQADA
jgi:predicted nucleic acid-binding protein